MNVVFRFTEEYLMHDYNHKNDSFLDFYEGILLSKKFAEDKK